MASFRFRFRSPLRDKGADQARLSSILHAVRSAVSSADSELSGLQARLENARQETASLLGTDVEDGIDRHPNHEAELKLAEERKAMQISIANLSKEVASLKTSLDAANKAAHSQIAKITERFDRAASSDITGSISAPQTIAPLPSPRECSS